MIDVGQGDSILIHSNNESILIDTGGVVTYGEEEKSKIVLNTTIPLLKSLGIKQLKYLILTHGDADHMGEAKYLIKNF
jgi:competence protein ComEC